MKILMIDDIKCPTSFYKDRPNNIRFEEEEVVLAKNYSDGMTELEKGPWDILLIDWNLNEFTVTRNGLKILNSLSQTDHTSNVKVDKVIIITGDSEIRKQMMEVCQSMKDKGTIKEFEYQDLLF